ncbi:MAG: hypothetical protein KME38_23235 [Spirirestis rafaelensis WJT71-NPBG6]|nr:hypothetical protein [Spirirestis rafaelensis WJT71-NPBG6]
MLLTSRFWFSINDDCTIVVASSLREESPNAKPMSEFNGDRIILPTQEEYYPRVDALRWHRDEFVKRVA